MRAIVSVLISFACGAGLVMLAGPGGRRRAPRAPAFERRGAPATPAASPSVADTARYGEPAPEVASREAAGVDVELVGDQETWHVAFGRGARVSLAAANAAEQETVIHLPVGEHVRFTLKSLDYIYMLSFAQSGKGQIAVPGQEYTFDLQTLSPGTFRIEGSHFCGPPRPALNIRAIAEPPAAFQAWLQAQDLIHRQMSKDQR